MNTETKAIYNKSFLWLFALGGLSLTYAFVSNSFSSNAGWLNFLAVFVLLSLITLGLWIFFKGEQAPKYLMGLLILAIAIRLMLGLVWFMVLPDYGYDTEMQRAGYVMGDAHTRDTAAWEFSQTDVPLIRAFQDYSYTDQYGGLIFISAFVYRYLAGSVHQPLLMAVVSAFISSLAILFVWGIAKQEFGEKVAKLSVWFLVLYPEAGLLGSSQMREAYSVTLLVLIVFIFMRFIKNRKKTELLLLFFVITISYYLSGPFAFSALILVGILTLWKMDWSWIRKGNTWLKKIALLIILMLLVWAFIIGIDKIYGVDYQEYLSLQASGKIAALFERIPEWTHRPFLVGYGVIRPLLPAALADLGNIVWGSISVWRSVGWTLMLTLTLYSTFLVFKEKLISQLPGAILLFVWIGILTSSYRGAGDDWDNPRYRFVFAGLQIVLAAWAVIKQRETKDPWFRRGVGFVASMLIWFLVWYINRNVYNFGFPTGNLTNVIGLGFACGFIYLVWDWLKTQKSAKNK